MGNDDAWYVSSTTLLLLACMDVCGVLVMLAWFACTHIVCNDSDFGTVDAEAGVLVLLGRNENERLPDEYRTRTHDEDDGEIARCSEEQRMCASIVVYT